MSSLNDKLFIAGVNQKSGSLNYFLAQVIPDSNEVKYLLENSFKEQFSSYDLARVRYLQNLVNGDIVFSAEFSNCVLTHMDYSTLCPVGPVTVVSWNDKLKWETTVYKKQSSNDNADSHLLVSKKNDTYVLFNDHYDNGRAIVSYSDVKKYGGSKTAIIIQKIDVSGKSTRDIVKVVRATTDNALVIKEPYKLYEQLTPSLYTVSIEGEITNYYLNALLSIK